jgi:hypothetical protein
VGQVALTDLAHIKPVGRLLRLHVPHEPAQLCLDLRRRQSFTAAAPALWAELAVDASAV